MLNPQSKNQEQFADLKLQNTKLEEELSELRLTTRFDRILKNIYELCLKASREEARLEDVLQVVLEHFTCDRVWLIFPCDIKTGAPRVVYEAQWCSKDQAPTLTLTPSDAEIFQKALETDHAVKYDPETPWSHGDEPSKKRFNIQSMLYMALKSKIGLPWLFCIHHCTEAHVFTPEETKVFTRIGRCLTETLNNVLSRQELEKSCASLAEAQRIAHIGSWDLDLVHNVLTWSDQIYRLFGQEPQQFEATYEAFLEKIHPEDREEVNCAYHKSLKDKTSYTIVHRLLLEEGVVKYVKEWCETFYDLSGNPIRSIGTVQDITDQKLVEDQLRQSAVIVENMADAAIITDEKNNIIQINRAYTEITGYTSEEVIGTNPKVMRSEEHEPSFYVNLWKEVFGKGMWQGEIWSKRKNGEPFPAWSTITSVQNAEGKEVNYIQVFSDISSIKRSQEKLDFLAHHDPLTGLPNRIFFNDRLDHALQHAKRDQKKVAVIFIDLDRFKTINDSLGHPVGDLVLQEAARRIKGSLRAADTVARLGGDEFILLIENVKKPQDVAVVAKKLLTALSQAFLLKEHELHLSASVGISLYSNDGEGSETLIRNADTAMYRAKEEGRNNFQFYTSSLTMAACERLTLQTALHHALQKNEFLLHYQPQYSLKTEKITAAEALIRWNNPDLGFISPDKFIPQAEESGIILSIGEWVLETACRQMYQWLKTGYVLDHVSVNVSGIQIQRGNIVESVTHILKKTGLPASRLEIEITESTAMQQLDRVIKDLGALSQMGVSISIDDFGTGHSSLSYLKRLPLNNLKIDRSFVRDIPTDKNDSAIARAVIALGQSLELGVIAEGVETKEQQQFLADLGCDAAQGYLFSRPVSAEQVTKLLKKAEPITR